MHGSKLLEQEHEDSEVARQGASQVYPWKGGPVSLRELSVFYRAISALTALKCNPVIRGLQSV